MDAAWAEGRGLQARHRAEGRRETLAWMEATGTHGIVLAGRLYHNDLRDQPRHPRAVDQLHLAVLTEGTPSRTLAHAGAPQSAWWTSGCNLATRLYGGEGATERADLDLVQLNSFGCGLTRSDHRPGAGDPEAAGKVYTVLKIDEVSNLAQRASAAQPAGGASRIRLTSRPMPNARRVKRSGGVVHNSDKFLASPEAAIDAKNRRDRGRIAAEIARTVPWTFTEKAARGG